MRVLQSGFPNPKTFSPCAVIDVGDNPAHRPLFVRTLAAAAPKTRPVRYSRR